MTPSNSRIRWLLVLGNVSLALGIAGCFVAFYASAQPDERVDLLDLEALSWRGPPEYLAGNDDLVEVAQTLSRRVRPRENPSVPPSPPELPVGPDDDTGPLAGFWEYSFYIFVKNARGSSVILKRKHASASSTKRSSRLRSRRAGKIAPRHRERIQVILDDGSYTNEGLDIDIRVVSVSPSKFLYSDPGDADHKIYQLVRQVSGYELTGHLAPRTVVRGRRS